MRSTLVLTIVLSFCTAASGGDPGPSREAFTEDFVRRLTLALPGHAFRVAGPLDVRDDAAQGVALAPLRGDLARLYADCQQAPAQRAFLLERYLAGLSQSHRNFERTVARDCIHVVVRPRSECDRLRAYHENREGFLFARPLRGDLMQVVVSEQPGVETPVNEKQRAALGLDETALFALGIEQTGRRLAGTLAKLAAAKPAGVQVIRGSGVSALLVLPPEAWAACRQAWGTDLVVSAPGNSCVLLGPKADEKELRAQVEREYRAADIPLSREVLTMTAN